jgi:general secretion pathway protein N
VKARRWIIALGIGAALVFAVATLPASLFAGRIEKYGLQVSSLYGTVWSGAALGLGVQGRTVGDLRWTISPLRLLTGRLAGHAVLTRPDGRLETDFVASLAGTVVLSNANANLPLSAFEALPLGFPPGWRGHLTARVEELVIESGWPQAARGEIELDALTAPPPRNANVGSYLVVLPDPGSSAADGEITAAVTDKEGPLSVQGRLGVSADRSFLLEGTLAARGSTPPGLERSLQLLGPADESGRRPFSVSGTL